MKVETTTTLTLTERVTVQELLDHLSDLPGEGTVDITVDYPDRPGEGTVTRIEVTH